MGGGVGFEEVESTGDNDVERCRSGFVGVVGTGGVGIRATGVLLILGSLGFRFEPLVLLKSSAVRLEAADDGTTTDDDIDDDIDVDTAAVPVATAAELCDFPLTFPPFSLPDMVSVLTTAVPPLPEALRLEGLAGATPPGSEGQTSFGPLCC